MDGGYNADDAKAFIGAFQDNFFNYPIFQNYMRIPGTPEMQEVWDVHLSEAITGQVSAKEALDRTYADWVRIVADLGKDEAAEAVPGVHRLQAVAESRRMPGGVPLRTPLSRSGVS